LTHPRDDIKYSQHFVRFYMSSGTCEFRPVDYKSVKPGRNKSVLTLSPSRNLCRQDGEKEVLHGVNNLL